MVVEEAHYWPRYRAKGFTSSRRSIRANSVYRQQLVLQWPVRLVERHSAQGLRQLPRVEEEQKTGRIWRVVWQRHSTSGTRIWAVTKRIAMIAIGTRLRKVELELRRVADGYLYCYISEVGNYIRCLRTLYMINMEKQFLLRKISYVYRILNNTTTSFPPSPDYVPFHSHRRITPIRLSHAPDRSPTVNGHWRP